MPSETRPRKAEDATGNISPLYSKSSGFFLPAPDLDRGKEPCELAAQKYGQE